MDTSHVLGLLSILTGCLLIPLGESWTIDVPGSVTAVEDSCVEVYCHTEPHQRVIWYQYHGMNYPEVYNGKRPTSVEHRFRGRTSVPGNATKGDCTLRIDNVRKKDNQLQLYVWINPDQKQSQKFHHQIVTINVVGKEAPVILVQRAVVEGAPLQANCSVQHSCPSSPPPLHWNTLPENSTVENITEEKRGLWVFTSRIQARTVHQLHNTVMRCTALFSSVPMESQPISLNVSYAPVSVKLTLEEQPVTEGHSVNMKCVADSNPTPHSYAWIRRQGDKDIQINSTNKDSISFSNIIRNTSFSCVAHNNFGERQSAWLCLDVHFPPVILSASTCSLKDGNLSCVCQAEAYPEASLNWTINGEDTLPPSFTSVTIYRQNVVSTQITGPVDREPNVSCSALNSVGRATRQMPFVSGTTWAPRGIMIGMAFGCAFLWGCAILIFRIWCNKRKSQGSPCTGPPTTNIPLRQSLTSENQRYSSPQRPLQRSVMSRPETKAIDSTIYENEFVPKKLREATTPYGAQRCKKDRTQDLQSDNDDIYQN